MDFNRRETASHSWLSIVLVVTQFLLLVLIMLAGRWLPTHWGLKGMMIFSGVIALWAFLAIGFGNLRPFPEIPPHGRLVMHGPYHWVRHPMYSCLLVLTLALTIDQPLPIRLILWVGLVVTLWVKLNYEEQLLLEKFPRYEEYRMRTKRIIPFLL